jgi:phosphate-selective porin OprO/OprP
LWWIERLGFGAAFTAGTARGHTENTGLGQYLSQTRNEVFVYRKGSDLSSPAIADGARRRVDLQGYYYAGRFGALSEYILSTQVVARGASQDSLTHHAWQVAVTFLLTDDLARFDSVVPKRDFDPSHGGTGAIELTGRMSQLILDPKTFPNFANTATSVSAETSYTLGINWYLNVFSRFVLNYVQTSFTHGHPGGNRPTEHALAARCQVRI